MTEHKFTTFELENERWLPVVGYEGYYSVSDFGRIRRDLAGSRNAKAGRILKPGVVRGGYLGVDLSKQGVRKSVAVHILVAAAFHGACPAGMQVNHKDPKTGKTDNRASNLEYCTRLENMRHAVENGLIASGDRNGTRTHPEQFLRRKSAASAELIDRYFD